MVKCTICNREYKVIGYWHLKKHGLSRSDYLLKYPNAITYSEELKHIRSAAFSGSKNPMYGKGFKGEANPMHGKCGMLSPRYGRKHSEATRKTLSAIRLGKSPWNIGLTKESDKRVAQQSKAQQKLIRTKEHCLNISLGKRGKPVAEEVKAKLRIVSKRKFQDPNFCRWWGRIHALRPNKLEQATLQLLNNHSPNEWRYTGDFSFTISGFAPDFTNVNGHKVCIEVYHPYWKVKHWGSVERYKRIRRYHYGKMGWYTIFLTADNIYKKPEYCVRKITHALEGEVSKLETQSMEQSHD